jgi:hypothetical protein
MLGGVLDGSFGLRTAISLAATAMLLAPLVALLSPWRVATVPAAPLVPPGT